MENKESAENKAILVTGAAGFIGYYLSKRLLEQGFEVVGIDNINGYYDIHLKYARLDILNCYDSFRFERGDIADAGFIERIFIENKPDIVVNLAAQAGVHYSIENPDTYIQSNIVGFYNILEACRRQYKPRHLVYASSSSVYGANTKVPFEETDNVDNPVSLYAVTKKTNELMAYTYSRLYGIHATGLRFFTVYGPMGRPDMAYYTFTRKFFAGEPISIFNNGDYQNDLSRDFTYIDDIVEGIQSIMYQIPGEDQPHRILNIGNNRPEKLMRFIAILERALSKKLKRFIQFEKVFEPNRAGDVPVTFASIESIKNLAGFEPKTSIEEGLQKFADWYVDYYKVE
jgi:UDP-glucuronate 4-epimerase